MTDDDAPKPLDELLQPGSTLMVGTDTIDGVVGFRPLTVARVRDHGAIKI